MRQGWANEKSGLFERPALYSPVVLDMRIVELLPCHNSFSQPASSSFRTHLHSPALFMSASAAIADPLLRQAFGRRARDAAQRFRDESS